MNRITARLAAANPVVKVTAALAVAAAWVTAGIATGLLPAFVQYVSHAISSYL